MLREDAFIGSFIALAKETGDTVSYSCRRSGFLSRYPYGSTQSSVTPVPEDLMFSSGHCRHTHGAYIHPGTTFMCIKTDESNLAIERLVLAV